jgi:hypothetical protein
MREFSITLLGFCLDGCSEISVFGTPILGDTKHRRWRVFGTGYSSRSVREHLANRLARPTKRRHAGLVDVRSSGQTGSLRPTAEATRLTRNGIGLRRAFADNLALRHPGQA